MDPKEMTDEQLKEAIEPQEAPAEPEEEPAVEEAEEAPAEAEPEGEAPVEEPAAEEKPPSRRENLRIQKLLQQNAELRKQTEAPTQEGLDYKTALDADPEVISQIEAEAQRRQQAGFTQGLEQAKSLQFHTRLEIDAPKIENQYPQLNPKSTEFNPATADAINTMYLRTVGYDATTDTVQNTAIRYADYVESLMELANELAGEKVTESSKNIAKQAASTALRPDGSRPKTLNLNKAPEDMTDEELSAVIAQTIPETGRKR